VLIILYGIIGSHGQAGVPAPFCLISIQIVLKALDVAPSVNQDTGATPEAED
jgi:hypothetical protein